MLPSTVTSLTQYDKEETEDTIPLPTFTDSNPLALNGLEVLPKSAGISLTWYDKKMKTLYSFSIFAGSVFISLGQSSLS